MKGRPFRVLAVAALSLALLATSAGAAGHSSEFEGFSASFRLKGSNGYRVAAYAFSERADGKGAISISVAKKGETATYTAPAVVTESSLRADLGVLGRIDAVRHDLGDEKSVRLCGGPEEAYKTATYEGSFEFRGEGGYTVVHQSRAPISPLPYFNFPCHGSGRGEELNSGRLPGARLKGTSFSHGRVLKFQVNKNRPGAPTVFTATLHERRAGIRIYRAAAGTSPASAFLFPHSLRSATLAPPAPFSGRAVLSRSRNSVVPTWRGDLALDFPGAPGVPVAGSGVYVTLVHARFTRGDGSSVGIGFGRSH